MLLPLSSFMLMIIVKYILSHLHYCNPTPIILIAASTTPQHEMCSLCSIFVFDAPNVINTDMITIESISSLAFYTLSFAIMLQCLLPLLRHLHLHSLPLRLWLSASFLPSSTSSPVAAFYFCFLQHSFR
jgi:hypothetical protein